MHRDAEAQLFDASVSENVRGGMRNAPADKIIDASKKARLHDFIMSLPNGYGTEIGENGARLSGGQRQRISIARAFLKDAPILSLDEMTSNVDPINESRIQNAVTELAERRPAIVIAHRLKTVQNAEPILVFQRNALVEAGTRRALLERGGYYKSLREKTNRTYSLPPCSSARTWQNHVTGNRARMQFP